MKDLQITSLIDQYEKLLTDRQKEIISGYYEFDLSLGEMAEVLGVTRQAVRDTLVKATAQLEYYEQNFKLKHIKEKLVQAAEADEKSRAEIIGYLIEILS